MLKQNKIYISGDDESNKSNKTERKVETEKMDTEDKLEDDFCNFDDKLLDQTD